MTDFKGYSGFRIKSPRMLAVFNEVYDFAIQGQPIVMFGPSGAGKEFLARYYFEHYKKASGCKGKLFSLNCAGLYRELAMSDLFGHVKGSFTDAYESRSGLIEKAKDGVLFLDEVGDLDESVQAMLLRAIDENVREARRVGDDKNYTIVNTLVICATEKDKITLRKSFLYRLGFQIHVPGLGDRPEDVEEAIKFFCAKAIEKRRDRTKLLSSMLNKSKDQISRETMKDPFIEQMIQELAQNLSPLVMSREWPGNFRALRTAVDSGVIRAKNLNSVPGFIDDVRKYFLHHLGDYSLSAVEQTHPTVSQTEPAREPDEDKKWSGIMNNAFPNIDDTKKRKMSAFMADYEDKTFTCKVFQEYIGNISTRVAQLHLKNMVDQNILKSSGSRMLRYKINDMYRIMDHQVFKLPIFMQLPAPEKQPFLPEKELEAIGVIENSQGLFISEDDPVKRRNFLILLGNRLQKSHEILYFSFENNQLDDFVNECTAYLLQLDIDGWFKKEDTGARNIQEQIIGISGYINQILLKHKKTIMIFDVMDKFKTSDLQNIIDKLIFFWHPVQFIFGTDKQFFQQYYANSLELVELRL